MSLEHTWSKLNKKATVKKELGHTTVIQKDVFRFQIPVKRKKNDTLEMNSDFVIVLTTGREH